MAIKVKGLGNSTDQSGSENSPMVAGITPVKTELENIRKKLHELAHAVLIQLAALDDAMSHLDRDKLLSIVESDKDIDNLEMKIDDVCLLFMGHRAPLGENLRFALGATNIAAGLERIGDCVLYVARYLSEKPELKTECPEAWNIIQEMVRKTAMILEKAFDTWQKQDARSAAEVPQLDDIIDQLQQQTYQVMIGQVRSQKLDVENGLVIVLLANKLESAGDIACHISETIVFMIRGDIIRHNAQTKSHSHL